MSGVGPGGWVVGPDGDIVGPTLLSYGFTADAVLRATRTGSLTANAVLKRNQSAALTLDAVIRLGGSGSFSANAVLRVARTGSISADAVLHRGNSGSFPADAVLRRGQTGSFTANSFIVRRTTGSFTADAAIIRSVDLGSGIGGSAIVGPAGGLVGPAGGLVGPFGANNYTFTANAVLRAFRTGSITVDAWLRQPIAGSFFADAVLSKTRTASFTADAVLSPFARITSQFATDAVLKGTQAGQFVARAWIKKGTTGDTGEDSVHIKVGGIDITDDVLFEGATFTMLVNGAPGECYFRVKDTTRTRKFTSGAEITLDVAGIRRFGGYLMQPKRAFFFDVEDTSDVSKVSRQLILTGVDYNILFQKRIVYDKADPANVNLRSWPAGSRDDTVIKYVFDHYTDLGLDGATYDGVEHVGSPNPGRVGVIGSGGLTFGDAMREINRLIDGVFYFDPYKDLKFVDVDTPNASKSLSDRPDGGTEIGPREFSHTENGSRLANDALVWGAGEGSTHVAFARAEDPTSQGVHGLWQFGEFTPQLFRQASVDQRANSIVFGSPQSKRGGKDDQVSWAVKTFDQAFVVGQKVQIESEVFGVSDVVPIRRMTITFPTTKEHPRFDMVLSHEIDEPWNMFEFFFPSIKPFEFILPTIRKIFDASQPLHWYYGTYTHFISSSLFGGIASLEAAPGYDTLYSSNTAGADFIAGATYTYAVGMIFTPYDYAPGIGLNEHPAFPLGGPGGGNIWRIGGGDPGPTFLGGTGSFVSPGSGIHHVASGVAKGAIDAFTPQGDHTVNVTYLFDPVGWVAPMPNDGDQVINDRPIQLSATEYQTYVPYEPGSLVVTLDGVPTAVTETDPSTGLFTLASPVAGGVIVLASYIAAIAGGGSVSESQLFGPACEFAVRVDSTHYQLSRRFGPGSTRVWISGEHMQPGGSYDYTEDTPASGSLTFASPVSLFTPVYVCYDATGAL